MSSKVLTLAQLLEKKHSLAEKIILCCGCFDIVHPGHIRHLAYAKSKADILVVSVTADRHITKGAYRPHVPERIRAESVAALEMVDYVIIDDNPTPIELIAALRPDYFAKGFEYSDHHNAATDAETKAVESYGGQMVFTPGDIVYSSSALLESHLPKLHIEKLASLMQQFGITFDKLRLLLVQLQFRVHVVGDNIIDTYTRTRLIGANAKTPTFSVAYESQQNYVGGAGVVAQHLDAAGANRVLTCARRVTKKNTIIAGDMRMLKIDHVDNSPIPPREVEDIAHNISTIKADAVIFSDFRHGLFHKNSIDELTAAIPAGAFKAADSQVASRWGNITDFKGFDLVTPNEKEARFALGDQDSTIGQLTGDVQKACGAKNVILKLGARGVFALGEDVRFSVDSFADKVVDPVGCGDAMLAYATLAMVSTGSLAQAAILGSMAAACECELDGNIPVTPAMILAKLDKVERQL